MSRPDRHLQISTVCASAAKCGRRQLLRLHPGQPGAYLLKAVIHDRPDADAIQILRCCRRSMPARGRLLLVEQLLDKSPNPVRTAFSDLTTLLMAGGQERTTDEYR
jgi:hypothetical protein